MVACLLAAPAAAQEPTPAAGQEPAPAASEDDAAVDEPSPEKHPGSGGLDVQGVPEGTPVQIVAPPTTAGAPIVVIEQEEPPKEMPYDEGDPIPPGYELTTKKYRGLIIGGAVTAGVLYGMSAVVGIAGLADGNSGAGVLLVPVAGPFIGAATLGEGNDFRKPGIAVGLGQAAGVTMLVLGLVLDKQVLERVPTPTAQVGSDQVVLGATGHF